MMAEFSLNGIRLFLNWAWVLNPKNDFFFLKLYVKSFSFLLQRQNHTSFLDLCIANSVIENEN